MGKFQTKLSLQKQKAYNDFTKIIQWGRQNPILFAEHMFGIKLMDFQKYVFMETWCRPFSIWLMSRGAGKTALMAVYLMTKMLLIPNWTVFVAGTTHPQAVVSFKKLENIACGREPSFRDCTDIFLNEIEQNRNNERFKHGAQAHQFRLYNNSSLQTLSSNEDGVRGKRGAVWYDESAWMRRNYFTVVDQFINVEKSYTLSVDDTGYIDPPQQPLQLIYTSSAGPASMPFFEKFKTFSKHMIAGNLNYFACNIDVNTLLEHTTVDGIKKDSHMNKDQIQAQIRDNPDAADRELFNRFTRGGGRNSVLPEEVLVRNSIVTPPVLFNDTGKRKFIFGYDPARNYDNSILAIGELIDDEKVGLTLNLVNIISMVDERKTQKTPLPMNKQIEVIWETMMRYNGDRAAEWENIEIYVDAGSGGGPRSGVFDHMMDPYVDPMGVEHRGIIDPIDPQYEQDRFNHRDAAKIVRLLEPSKYKNKIFGALEELTALNLIKFPVYDGHSDNLLLDDSKNDDVGYTDYALSLEEKEALVQIELAKSELSYMIRTESATTRKVSYELTGEKRHTMHDDRAYAVALLAYALWEKRDKDLRERRPAKVGPIIEITKPDLYGHNKKNQRHMGLFGRQGR